MNLSLIPAKCLIHLFFTLVSFILVFAIFKLKRTFFHLILDILPGAYFTPEKSYPFSFELKSDLPSTFRSEYGEVKYRMKFVIVKRWINLKQKISFKVIKNVNLNQIPASLQPFENQLTKSYGLVDAGPISLHVSIPKRGFTLGEKIPITVC